MVSEDFSFPKITNPVPHFIFSPSLWRVSSLIYPEYVDDDDDDDQESEDEEKQVDSQEKMDMLWEDFNEELKRVSSLEYNKIGMRNLSGDGKGGSEREMGEFYCLQRLKVSKAAGNDAGPICRRRRAGNYSMVLMKVFKKIFMLQNSALRMKIN